MRPSAAESLLWSATSLCVTLIVVSDTLLGNIAIAAPAGIARAGAVLGAAAVLATLGLLALTPSFGRTFPALLYGYFTFFSGRDALPGFEYRDLPACLALVAIPLGLHFLLRRCRPVAAAACGLTVTAAVALAIASQIAPLAFYSPLSVVVEDFRDATQMAVARHHGDGGVLPDIIYVVPDRYPSAATLRRKFAMDNEPFYDALRTRGFIVTEDAHANYPTTFQSLASTLNGGYLDRFTAAYGTDSGDHRPVLDAIEDNVVQARLRRLGYRYHHHGASWEPTRVNRWAHVNDTGSALLNHLSELERAIINRTPTWDVAALFTGRQDTSECRRIQRQMLRLETAGNGPRPVFVFAHVFVPHEPITMDAAGRCLDRPLSHTATTRAHYDAAFSDYVRYFNAAILRVIDRQLESRRRQDRELLFVIQSDEGPYPAALLHDHEPNDFAALTQHQLRMKMGTLNALRPPPGHALKPALLATPVNNWRIIFNMLAGTTLNTLPHRIYIYPSAQHIYRFCEVTPFVARQAPPPAAWCPK